MPLIISTPLQIFLLDEISKKISIQRSGDGYYFGITHRDDVIVLSHSGGYLQYFRKNAKPTRTIKHLYQPHQIEWVEDKILVANTGRNCISVYNASGHLERDVYLNEVHWDDKNANRKGNHFNSVHKFGDTVYVVAHNYERPSEIWELGWPGLQVKQVLTCQAGWAHDIWVSDLGKVVCDSKNSCLRDVSTNETLWRSNEINTLTRGLAVTQENIFVGYSSISERHDRFWKSGGIFILDRDSFKTIDKVPILGSGDIYEIRVLDKRDECHNSDILSSDSIESIRSESTLVNLAYRGRRKYSFLQQNVFPISPLVRFRNMIPRWKNTKINR
jgi:hypothetical protein